MAADYKPDVNHQPKGAGADNGNRNRLFGLGSRHSTNELYLHMDETSKTFEVGNSVSKFFITGGTRNVRVVPVTRIELVRYSRSTGF